MFFKPVLLAVAFTPEVGLPADAHDIYSHLVVSSGQSCCVDHDCRPAPYRVSAARVEMFAYGRWISVPADKIQYHALPGDTGESGGGHWCGLAYQQRNGRVVHVTQCAVLPPTMAASERLPVVPGDGGVPPFP